MNKIWKINSQLTANSRSKRQSQIIKEILKNRGIKNKIQQKDFLNPKHPKNISIKKTGISQKQIKIALSRLKKALNKKQIIYIYGDYDVDGITATAVLWEALNKLGFKIMPFIPSREDSTRGLSKKGIDEIIKLSNKKYHSKPNIIITVDNGIGSFKGVEYAKKKDIDVIITDHHQPKTEKAKEILPKAHAIIHSVKIAGVGVSWFLVREISNSIPPLDLVAIGTIADMVPLTNINRSLVKFGLKQLNSNFRIGLKELSKLAEIDIKDIKAYEISFSLAPRLNAMARLDNSMDSLRLLCTNNLSKAKKLAKKLNNINKIRQNKTDTMFIHAKQQYLNENTKDSLIFVKDKSYHQGIVGLIASRLVNQFHKPAFVISEGDKESKSSARSIKGFDLAKNLKKIDNFLKDYGGHKLAAGFTAQTNKLNIIKKTLIELANKTLDKKDLIPKIQIDCEINFNDINWSLFNQIEKLKPFGIGNARPIFITKQVQLIKVNPVGSQNKHLQLYLQACPDLIGSQSLKVKAIAFNMGYLAEKLQLNQKIDIAYTIDQNIWNNKKTLQLKIKDILII